MLFVLFFLYGFGRSQIYLHQLQDEVVNHPKEYNEIMLEVYDHFSEKYILEDSVYSGLVNGSVFSLGCVYLIGLVSLLSGSKLYHRWIGISLLVFTIVILILYLYFVNNFKIDF